IIFSLYISSSRRPPTPTLFPYTTLFRSNDPLRDPDYPDEAPNALMAWYKTWYNRQPGVDGSIHAYKRILREMGTPEAERSLKETDRKSTRLNSSHVKISYAVFCLKKKII